RCRVLRRGAGAVRVVSAGRVPSGRHPFADRPGTSQDQSHRPGDARQTVRRRAGPLPSPRPSRGLVLRGRAGHGVYRLPGGERWPYRRWAGRDVRPGRLGQLRSVGRRGRLPTVATGKGRSVLRWRGRPGRGGTDVAPRVAPEGRGRIAGRDAVHGDRPVRATARTGAGAGGCGGVRPPASGTRHAPQRALRGMGETGGSGGGPAGGRTGRRTSRTAGGVARSARGVGHHSRLVASPPRRRRALALAATACCVTSRTPALNNENCYPACPPSRNPAMTSPLRILLVALACPALALAGNWPAWRGSTGDGRCTEKDLPLEWNTTKNVRWKVPLPDEGNSTPVVWRNRLFLTQATQRGTHRALLCLDRSNGKQLWKAEVQYKEKEPTHGTNPYCSASPVTDGERVLVSHGSAGLFCYSLDGKE